MDHDSLISDLQKDLLINILRHSEDIGKCAIHITTQIREIIGSRVVALFETIPGGDHCLIGACPDRKKEIFQQGDLRLLVEHSGSIEEPTLVKPEDGEIGRLLTKLGMKESFVVPLRVGKETFGLLLLLDIMDSRGIEKILEALKDISGLLSLILKNSFLFRNLETLVEQRTSALRKSEARSMAILQSALDGFWIVDKMGKILDVNDAYCKMIGYTREELLLMTIPQVETVESKEEVLVHIQRVLAGEHARFETAHRRKDGSLLFIDLSAQRLPGTETEIFSFLRDITERKQAEQAQKKLQEQLNQAQKMESIGRLAGGVAHDFNNMLGVILGHTELAMEQVDSSQPLQADLEEIQKAAQRSADLTRQLLAFARKQTIATKILNLNDIIPGMLKMLQRLIGEDVDLSWKSEAELWSVKMDPSQIDQILTNLCVNARDAIAGVGKILIETGNRTIDEAYCSEHNDFSPGEYVLLTVSDNGLGMNQEIMNHIFEPFFTTKAVGQGTGLGLATVYGIVKQNKGFIIVNSSPGKGTTIRIFLPRYLEMVAQTMTKVPADCFDGDHETVLLVEDEPAILKMVGRILEKLRYNVLTAGSPGEAIRLAEEYDSEIHLLITDVIMPEMSGLKLSESLLSFYPNLKRLFMSGYTADLIAHRGILEEGVQFIQKPFSKNDLADKIRQVLKTPM
jgi:PAS domain S-box-containing protein